MNARSPHFVMVSPKKGAMALAMQATNTRRTTKSWPLQTTMAMWYSSSECTCQRSRYSALSRGSQSAQAGSQAHGIGAERFVSQSQWRVRFEGESKGDLQCWNDSEYSGESAPSPDHQAGTQAVVQCSHPCLAGSSRADLCMGGHIQAAALSV